MPELKIDPNQTVQTVAVTLSGAPVSGSTIAMEINGLAIGNKGDGVPYDASANQTMADLAHAIGLSPAVSSAVVDQTNPYQVDVTMISGQTAIFSGASVTGGTNPPTVTISYANAANPNYGDLLIAKGNLVLTDDASGETTSQLVACRLRLFLGEWFLDTRLGVDYLGQILVKDPDLAAIGALLKATILATPGVASVTSYSQTYDSQRRSFSVTWAGTSTGGAPIGGTL